MYTLKHPKGLKQRIACLGGLERALRLSLIRDNLFYVARDSTTSLYLKCYDKEPTYINGVFWKTGERQEPLNSDVFLFLKPGDILNIKTMEVNHNVTV